MWMAGSSLYARNAWGQPKYRRREGFESALKCGALSSLITMRRSSLETKTGYPCGSEGRLSEKS